MENEVIIDGVNVAKCMYAANSIPIDCENDTCFCYENPNCYFKQLQRAKAENEKLKEKYLASLRDNAINTELKLINDNLKSENEKLKADKKELLKDCNSCNFHKYKKALEDIREIAKKYKNMEGCRIPLGAIEMRINEVLNEH